jgi:hypothetical protein
MSRMAPMTSIWRALTTPHAKARPRKRASRVGACLSAVVLLLSLATAASAQQTAPPPDPQAPAVEVASPEPPPASRPGFLRAIRNWLGRSFGAVNSGIKNTRETIAGIGGKAGRVAKGAASTATNVAKGTAKTIVRLPGTRLVNGREKCTLAPNGGPDCYAAAATLCHNKGFAGGKSVETQSARKCPARVWLSARAPQLSECTSETFVTRAVCN